MPRNRFSPLVIASFVLLPFLSMPALAQRSDIGGKGLNADIRQPAVESERRDVGTDRDFKEEKKDYSLPGWFEPDTDRPGSNYRNFWLSGGPEQCQEACTKDPDCKAYTYVKPGIQGRQARCWLKSGAPKPVSNRCCVSGVKATKTEPGVDRRARPAQPSNRIPQESPAQPPVAPERGLEKSRETAKPPTRPPEDIRRAVERGETPRREEPKSLQPPAVSRRAPEPKEAVRKPIGQIPARTESPFGDVMQSVKIGEGQKRKESLSRQHPQVARSPDQSPDVSQIVPVGKSTRQKSPYGDIAKSIGMGREQVINMPTTRQLPQIPGEPPAQPQVSLRRSPDTPKGQHTTAQKMTQVTQIPVSQQLEKMAHLKLQELRTKLKSEITYRGQNQKDTPTKQDPTPALKTCESAQITSVISPKSTTPATIRPGWPLTIKGCGFLSVTDLLMYDPKGPNDAFSKPWYLKIDKLTDTEIETHIPKVDPNSGIGFFTKPISISVRTYSLGKKGGYSNPGNLVLEPNMEIYIVQGLKPAKLGSCGPTLVDSNSGVNTVFHMPFSDAPIQLDQKKSGKVCSETDILFWGKKLDEGFTFENAQIIYKELCYTTDHTWEQINPNNCVWGEDYEKYPSWGAHGVSAKMVEKNIDDFKGTPFAPMISVNCEINFRSALLYQWAVFVRGPEGLASFGF